MEQQPHSHQAREAQGPPGGGQFNSFQSAARSSAYSVYTASLAASSQSAATAQSTTNDGSGTTISTTLAFGSTTASLNEPEPTTSGTAASHASATGSVAVVTTSGVTTGSSSGYAILSTESSSASASLANSLTSQTTFETSTTAAVNSGGTASSPQTIVGSEISDPVASSTSGPTSAGSSFLPLTNHRHHGMSHGALAAAVVVPILFAMLVALLAFLCLQRKRRRDGDETAAFLPAMREKLGGVRTSVTPASPVVTSDHNNAYYTGLDTSSHGSQRAQSDEYYAPARRSEGGTFAEPPPPYKAKSLGSKHSGGSLQSPILPEVTLPGAIAIPILREPQPSRNESPFTDSISPVSPVEPTSAGAGGLLVSPIARPQTSRSTTNRSFTSDLYSDTASVHSARAARMSIAGAQMIGGGRRTSDPFGDPESPVSDAGEFHSLTRAGSSGQVSLQSRETRR